MHHKQHTQTTQHTTHTTHNTEHITYATHTQYAPNPTKCFEIGSKTRCLANALCGQETSQNAGVSKRLWANPNMFSRRRGSHFKPSGSSHIFETRCLENALRCPARRPPLAPPPPPYCLPACRSPPASFACPPPARPPARPPMQAVWR